MDVADRVGQNIALELRVYVAQILLSRRHRLPDWLLNHHREIADHVVHHAMGHSAELFPIGRVE